MQLLIAASPGPSEASLAVGTNLPSVEFDRAVNNGQEESLAFTAREVVTLPVRIYLDITLLIK